MKKSNHATDAPDLFPETIERVIDPVIFQSDDLCNQWGFPRVVVRLLPQWSEQSGRWTVGWFCNVDHAVDEWCPEHPVAPGWPWYRPSQQPESRSYAIACASAARSAKIVLEQMVEYAECDTAKCAIALLQQRIENQARQWLDAV
ncbi:hypothetical protein [Pseudomonas syringae]|uniref:hypothetical protein n=1 Tax=Pseudomonas syringae TaxID=317 RepID=UPI0013723277|nr:hypothetical protein [Pseudomonas syringae]NAP32602.1 hypothetical protein [Pseudomonas syringae]